MNYIKKIDNKLKIIFKTALLLFLTCSLSFVIGQPNIISSYANTSNTFTTKIIANSSNQISNPRDLDFQPANGQLWVVNTGTTNSGGSTVRIDNPNLSNQATFWQRDGNAWHFMSLPSGIAFSPNGNFATSTSIYDANHNGGAPFTGPALWSSDPLIYAQPSGGNGSHLDMLHVSPYCMGIESEKDNEFRVTDMNSKDVVRYDFVADHGPGNSNHDDGRIRRFTGQSISWIRQNVSSHLALDANKKWMYIVDGGGKRVVRLDIITGTVGAKPAFPQYETLAEYKNVDGATWETVTDVDLIEPSGIAVLDDYLLVSDYSTGDVIVYDIITMPGLEVNRVSTPKGIQGITIGPDGRIWFVNSIASVVGRIEPALVTNVENVITKSNVLRLVPNPSSGELTISIDGLEGKVKAELYNMNGSRVGGFSINSSINSIDLSDYSKGVYILRVRNNSYNLTKKIVLQ